MPKMKSNRIASKKFRIGGTGRVKRAMAGTSHNSGKKPAKRIRHLKGRKVVDNANMNDVFRLLPSAGAKR